MHHYDFLTLPLTFLALQGYQASNRCCFGNYEACSKGYHSTNQACRGNPDDCLNPPRLRTFEELKKAAETAQDWCDAHPDEDFDPKKAGTKGVVGRSAFFDLAYFNPVTQCALDMMHIVSGVTGRHLVPLMTNARLRGVVSRDKASVAARKKMTPAQIEAEDDAPRFKAQAKEDAESAKAVKQRAAQHKRDLAIEKAKGSRRDALNNAQNSRDVKIAAKQAKARAESDRALRENALRSENDRPSNAEHLKMLAEKWNVPPATLALVEQHCYLNIAAPARIAPRSKKPLTLPSEMNSYQWLKFSTVYGPYLIANMYANQRYAEAGVEACELLNIITIVLSSQVTPEVMAEMREKVKNFTRLFHIFWPETEKSLVLHMLLMHMPATVEYWGPARSYWNFPPERLVSFIAIL